MKKILAMLLSVAIIATIAISGTIAYFTDTESATNVFTVGNVNIELLEQERTLDADGKPDNGALKDFVQGKNLMPIVGSAQGAKDNYGLPTFDAAKNYIDKIVRVKNIGESDAWVRVYYGVPTALEGDPDNAGDDVLHTNMGNRFDPDSKGKYNSGAWNVEGNEYYDDFGDYKTDNPSYKGTETIDGIEYNVWCYTMKHTLAVGDTSAAVLTGLYLDEKVDFNDADGCYYLGDKNDPSNKINYDLSKGVYIPVYAEAVQAAGFATAQEAFSTAIEGNPSTTPSTYNPWDGKDISLGKVVTAANSSELKAAVEAAEANENTVIELTNGSYTTNFKLGEASKDVTIVGKGKDTVLSGQIATTSSNAGTLTIKNVTIKVNDSISDKTDISQTSLSAIAIWGNQTVICENVTFDMSLTDSTAITSYFGTGVGTTIICRNCTFNCNGQRPIRATGNVTVENCTFNDPYRYAVQLTAKDDTATKMDKAIINFKNNTIVDGENGKNFVYGIQLEGADYGCHDVIINGGSNTITSSNTTDSAMYYCECGKVQHATITWNVETTPVHKGTA